LAKFPTLPKRIFTAIGAGWDLSFLSGPFEKEKTLALLQGFSK
jgi:hypothetical protein